MRYLAIILMVLLTGCGSNPYSYRPGTAASEGNQRVDRQLCSEKATEKGYREFPYKISDSSMATSVIGSTIGVGFSVVSGAGFIVSPKESPEITKRRQDFVESEVHHCMSSKGYVYNG